VGDVVETKGYTGQPFDILVGIDLDALIVGALVVDQDESLLRNNGGDSALGGAIAGLVGLDVLAERLTVPPGFAARGEVSRLAMLDAIYRAGRAVAVAKELKGAGEREGRRLDTQAFRALDWSDLRDMGAVKRLSLRNGDIAGHIASNAGAPADMIVAELYAALATPALIGRNLLGEETYRAATATDDQIILLGMSGGAVLSGELDTLSGEPRPAKFHLRQDGLVIALPDVDLDRIEIIAATGAPSMSRIVLAGLADDSGFDPTRPWTLELSLGLPGKRSVFALPYTLLPELVIEPVPHMVAAADNRVAKVVPLWVSIWLDQTARIAVLILGLVVLTAIVLFQERLARNPRLFAWIRRGFLVFTLVWIGWYAGAQVSVIHFVTLIAAPFQDNDLSAFSLDPLTVIILAFAGVGLLLLGRGVFCGWLCPFGALQELLNKAARRVGVKQIRLPKTLNERLWALKYLLVIALLGLALVDTERAARAVEIEPFNTAIMLGFARHWPYTVFAILVLGAGLFVERFFCRYVCPLGGGLALIGRWHVLKWFKRRPECGRDCAKCQPLCPVQAISDDGTINLSECFHCMACQTAYHDVHFCPPLVNRRERSERLSGGVVPPMAKAAAPAVD
jgi:NosR/NirI family nitrous oxide reductase transcriptional regulator